jgi:hypothetical protein
VKSDLTYAIGIALGLILLGGGGYAVYTMTRGLRNSNPGNIRYDGTAWVGLANPPSDGTFCVFTDPTYGIRAMATILQNYVAVDGVPSTVTAIISRWAPSSENDTASYISDVDSQLGLTPGNDAIDLGVSLAPLIAAIIQHENGINPYAANTIASGIALA